MRLKKLCTYTLSALLLGGVATAHGLDIENVSPHERLRHALLQSDYEKVSALAATLEDLDAPLSDGSTLLGWAADAQDPKLVRILLDAGADPNVHYSASNAPLLIACQYGGAQVIDALLDAGADVRVQHPEGAGALALCAAHAPTAIVNRMLDDPRIDIEQADAGGQTPLMWAARAGRVETMELLISYGANIEAVTEKGLTPLFFSLMSGEPQAPVVLMQAGANLSHVAGDGTTLIQIAMYQGAYDFAQQLLELGEGDLLAFDRNGKQLLHAAILAEQPQLVSLLLSKGADANAMTAPSKVEWRYERNFRAGDYVEVLKTPLELAEELGNLELVDMLIAAGAVPRAKEELSKN